MNTHVLRKYTLMSLKVNLHHTCKLLKGEEQNVYVSDYANFFQAIQKIIGIILNNKGR